MSSKVEIGKYTLESLTTGMYEQPLIVFREYIQNAVDALEEAFRQHLVSSMDMRIDITIDVENRSIEILDNGVGIHANDAERVLLSVGSSEKLHSESRGFRGIGRLGGLSYCDRLVFETTAAGSNTITHVEFNCVQLKELLLPGQSDGMSMEQVLNTVTSVRTELGEVDDHYFAVRMLDVSEDTGLLNEEEVIDYLSQTAPVPYPPYFFLSRHIHDYAKSHEITLTEFPVFVAANGKRPKSLYKACKRHYASGNDGESAVYEVNLFDIYSPTTGALLAIGWYADTDWAGTIKDTSIRGLRLRAGNIQIGDEHTLDKIFKQSRFNGWTQGEVFVVNDALIPNARRDNFELNREYLELIKALTDGIGSEISTRIGAASRLRNDPSKRVVDAAKKVQTEATHKIEQGFNSREEKEKTLQELEEKLRAVSTAKTKKPAIEEERKAVMEQLTQTLDAFEDVATYKSDALRGVLSKKEMNILRVASDVMTMYLDQELLDQIMNEIIARLSRKST